MSSQSGFTGIFCPLCDKSGTPARLVRQMAGKQEGMLLRCTGCNRTFAYAELMKLHPRMDQPEFVERQPAGTIVKSVWIHPEAWEALAKKFPHTLQTTLCACLASLADPDTVLIEGEYAREMASLGVRKGKEVLALAKEVKDLRDQVQKLLANEAALKNFFGQMGLAPPQLAQHAQQLAAAVVPLPSADPALLPPLTVDGQRNPTLPPAAAFSPVHEGFVMPGDQSTESPATFIPVPAGSGVVADGRPGFVPR